MLWSAENGTVKTIEKHTNDEINDAIKENNRKSSRFSVVSMGIPVALALSPFPLPPSLGAVTVVAGAVTVVVGVDWLKSR